MHFVICLLNEYWLIVWLIVIWQIIHNQRNKSGPKIMDFLTPSKI